MTSKKCWNSSNNGCNSHNQNSKCNIENNSLLSANVNKISDFGNDFNLKSNNECTNYKDSTHFDLIGQKMASNTSNDVVNMYKNTPKEANGLATNYENIILLNNYLNCLKNNFCNKTQAAAKIEESSLEKFDVKTQGNVNEAKPLVLQLKANYSNNLLKRPFIDNTVLNKNENTRYSLMGNAPKLYTQNILTCFNKWNKINCSYGFEQPLYPKKIPENTKENNTENKLEHDLKVHTIDSNLSVKTENGHINLNGATESVLSTDISQSQKCTLDGFNTRKIASNTQIIEAFNANISNAGINKSEETKSNKMTLSNDKIALENIFENKFHAVQEKHATDELQNINQTIINFANISTDAYMQNKSNATDDFKNYRVRSLIDSKQQKTLRSYFSTNSRPSTLQLDELAGRVGLSKRVVQVWFQNMRARQRRSNSPDPASQHQTSDNCDHKSDIINYSKNPLQLTSNVASVNTSPPTKCNSEKALKKSASFGEVYNAKKDGLAAEIVINHSLHNNLCGLKDDKAHLATNQNNNNNIENNNHNANLYNAMESKDGVIANKNFLLKGVEGKNNLKRNHQNLYVLNEHSIQSSVTKTTISSMKRAHDDCFIEKIKLEEDIKDCEFNQPRPLYKDFEGHESMENKKSKYSYYNINSNSLFGNFKSEKSNSNDLFKNHLNNTGSEENLKFDENCQKPFECPRTNEKAIKINKAGTNNIESTSISNTIILQMASFKLSLSHQACCGSNYDGELKERDLEEYQKVPSSFKKYCDKSFDCPQKDENSDIIENIKEEKINEENEMKHRENIETQKTCSENETKFTDKAVLTSLDTNMPTPPSSIKTNIIFDCHKNMSLKDLDDGMNGNVRGDSPCDQPINLTSYRSLPSPHLQLLKSISASYLTEKLSSILPGCNIDMRLEHNLKPHSNGLLVDNKRFFDKSYAHCKASWEFNDTPLDLSKQSILNETENDFSSCQALDLTTKKDFQETVMTQNANVFQNNNDLNLLTPTSFTVSSQSESPNHVSFHFPPYHSLISSATSFPFESQTTSNEVHSSDKQKDSFNKVCLSKLIL